MNCDRSFKRDQAIAAQLDEYVELLLAAQAAGVDAAAAGAVAMEAVRPSPKLLRYRYQGFAIAVADVELGGRRYQATLDNVRGPNAAPGAPIEKLAPYVCRLYRVRLVPGYRPGVPGTERYEAVRKSARRTELERRILDLLAYAERQAAAA